MSRLRIPRRQGIVACLRHDRGQSLVELAIVLPVLLLLLLVAIDFGRIYLGYINLQQMARVAANFAAEHASAWETSPFDMAVVNRYDEMVANDAATINCELPKDGTGNVDVPDPAFPGGFDLGDPVQIKLSCSFSVITPIISGIVGNTLLVGADVIYPIREGAVAEVPGGGGPVLLPPDADFFGTPQSGYQPLDVAFTDTSDNFPTSWTWNFGNGSAFTKGPHTRTYDCPAVTLPGESCTFSVSLTVGNAGGFDTETKSGYITVIVPPDTGPIADFVGSPLSGLAPLAVDFDFVERTTGIVYTDWQWDFGDGGAFDASGQSVSNTFSAPGAYSITLKVTDDAGNTHSLTKVAYVVASKKICIVPDFAGIRKNSAQSRWSAAGFTTAVQFLPGNGNYLITKQVPVGGVVDPQPDGCDSLVTVGP